jgi:hypothetical protein
MMMMMMLWLLVKFFACALVFFVCAFFDKKDEKTDNMTILFVRSFKDGGSKREEDEWQDLATIGRHENFPEILSSPA